MSICAGLDCLNEIRVRDGEFCSTCAKRRKRKVPLAAPMRCMDPWEQLTEAALAYAEAPVDDDKAWKRAKDRLRKAAQTYTRSLVVKRKGDEPRLQRAG